MSRAVVNPQPSQVIGKESEVSVVKVTIEERSDPQLRKLARALISFTTRQQTEQPTMGAVRRGPAKDDPS